MTTLKMGTDLKKAILDYIYPVGSYYETSNTSFNPNSAWGGTWVEDTKGKVTVSLSTDAEFNSVGKTGGAKTHTLTVDQMPKHRHAGLSWIGDDAGQSITLNNGSSGKGYNLQYYGGYTPGQETNIRTRIAGGGLAHNNLQPYVVVKRWHRTA